MIEIISIVAASLLINNIVLTSFTAASQLSYTMQYKWLKASALLLCGIILYSIQTFILVPYELATLGFLFAILVSAVVRYAYQKFIDKTDMLLYIMSIAFMIAFQNNEFTFVQAIAYLVGTILGFLLIQVIIEAIMYRLSFSQVPKPFKGIPILMFILFALALAFSSLSGII